MSAYPKIDKRNVQEFIVCNIALASDDFFLLSESEGFFLKLRSNYEVFVWEQESHKMMKTNLTIFANIVNAKTNSQQYEPSKTITTYLRTEILQLTNSLLMHTEQINNTHVP